MKKKGYVIANWKMNPDTVADAKELFFDIKSVVGRLKNLNVVIAPPIIFLAELRRLYSGRQLEFGAQNISFEEKGSFTGETSAKMARSIGTTYVIVGHSERRLMGETDKDVNKKIVAALLQKFTIVLCIGEKERDSQGSYLSFLEEELRSALTGVSKKSLKHILIAYEPIWAIGKTGKEAMSPRDVHETSLFLHKILMQIYDRKSAFAVPILYGGSVEPENNEELLHGGGISGFLVGHASLETSSFLSILKTSNNFFGNS